MIKTGSPEDMSNGVKKMITQFNGMPCFIRHRLYPTKQLLQFYRQSKSVAACTPIHYLYKLTNSLSSLNILHVHYHSLLQLSSAFALDYCYFVAHLHNTLCCALLVLSSATQHAYHLAYSHNPFGHADYDILIAAGGDGTINQVVNELVNQDAPKETCLAVIPLGTANDFATSLTIHDDNLVQAMQTAVQGIRSLGCF